MVYPPTNGRFQNPPETRYGSTLVVNCDEGYFLIGNNDVKCVDEDNDGIGEWDKMLPTCIREISFFFFLQVNDSNQKIRDCYGKPKNFWILFL